MGKSLYELERPADFSNVVGQDAVVKSLRVAVDSGKYANAYLFVGYAGCGKTTLARILAKKATGGDMNSIKELDAASNNGVDQIRALIEDADFATVSGRKVYILDEVHMLSQAASNALLKTLENPPEGVIFILCTTEEDKVIDTIKSRCRIFRLKRISPDVIRERLQAICDKYGKAATPDALSLIAAKCDGSMRNALTIMEPMFDADELLPEKVQEHLGILPCDRVFDILDNVSCGYTQKALEAVKTAFSDGRSAMNLVRNVLQAVNDTESVYFGADVSTLVQTDTYRQRVTALVQGMPDIELLDSLASGLKDVLRYSSKTDADIYLELAIRSAARDSSELSSLTKRVSELESRISELEARPAAAVGQTVTQAAPVEAALSIAEPVIDKSAAKPPVVETGTEEVPFEETFSDTGDDAFDGFSFVDEGVSEPAVPTEGSSNIVPFVADEEQKNPLPENPENPVAVLDISSHLPDGVKSEEMSAADFFGDEKSDDNSSDPAGEAAMPLVPEEDDLPPLDFAGFLWR